MRRLAVLALLALAFQPLPPVRQVNVQRVIDGDTVALRSGVRVRFLGVDTPETVHPGRPVQCFGPQASRFTKKHLERDRVGLEFDAEMLDRYGRTLAWVWDSEFPGRTFQFVLVRRGYARATFYAPNYRYRSVLLAAQAKAKRERRGLWGACT